jgi:hypothetical protein
MDSNKSFLLEIVWKLQDIQSNTTDEDTNNELMGVINLIEDTFR